MLPVERRDNFPGIEISKRDNTDFCKPEGIFN